MRRLACIKVIVMLLLSTIYVQSQTWKADPEVIKEWSKREGFNYKEENVPDYTLPDLFTSIDGIPVHSVDQWEAFRRDEIVHILEMQLFGKVIGKPDTVTFELIEKIDTFKNKAYKKTVHITFHHHGETLLMKLWMFVPKTNKTSMPAFLLANNRGEPGIFPSERLESGFWPAEKIIDRGYVAACFNVRDIDPDSNEDRGFDNGIHGLIEPEGERPLYAWGTLAAWAYGAKTAMDYFETDLDVDNQKVTIVGHSRGGKTALWAGASDKRFAITISNMSGCGGAALSRRRFGETVKQINTRFPNWFCKNFHAYNDNEEVLPFDQHMLLAMIAPRGLYVTSADKDLWADPRGEYLSLKEAEKVFELYRLTGINREKMPPLDSPVMGKRTGYHIRSGAHNMTPYDWEQFMNFADKIFER